MTDLSPSRETSRRSQEERDVICGWGRTTPAATHVVRVRDQSEVAALLARASSIGGASRRGVVPRGLGRSYGDAAQRAGGTAIDLTQLNQLSSDPTSATMTVGGGLSFDELIRQAVVSGYFVPVTPGTRRVTVGGAIAADVHGKNHHRDGSVAPWVDSLELVTPTGTRDIAPDRDPGLFWATAGGMGLTGVITRARIRLIAVESAWVMVDTTRTSSFDDTLDALANEDTRHRYSVAWLDCLSRGSGFGRGIITGADHARADDLPPDKRSRPLEVKPSRSRRAPRWAPSRLLNRLSVSAFNEAWFRRYPARETAKLSRFENFFHPLDGIDQWNRLYGRCGFVQYQSVVPFGAEEALEQTVRTIAEAGVPAFLAVLKRFGPPDRGHLSFPIRGWTLAVDLPVGPSKLGRVLDHLDEITACAGGRVYLAKDSRLRPDLVKAMYPRLAEWRAIRDEIDPAGVLRSDLSERLGLLGEDEG